MSCHCWDSNHIPRVSGSVNRVPLFFAKVFVFLATRVVCVNECICQYFVTDIHGMLAFRRRYVRALPALADDMTIS